MVKSTYISIGIPFYNAEDFLEDAIKSILCQTYENWELILIDDGSIDGSLEIAEKFQLMDSRISVVSDGKNKKLPYRLNQIIELAKYDYIARMDADDIMHIDRLKLQIDFLINNPNFDLISTSMYSIDSKNNITGKRIINDVLNLKSLLRGNYQIVHPTVLAKKEWYLRNKYDEGAERAEDYELWLRAIINNDLKISILTLPLFFYREFGNLNKRKLIHSYQTTNNIFYDFRDKISFLSLLKNKLVNFFKIIIVNILFCIGKENILISRRNMDLSAEELQSAKISLLKALSIDD